ncbi:MAG TPA: proton-conducting transporter membrane subunit [Opitutaceae bacterium]|nr:proton-conducting transporter membrane subunit [Opitutaceae bacterium]
MLLAVGFGLVAAILVGHAAPRLWLVLTLGGMGAALCAAFFVLRGGAEWNWRSGFPVGGEPLHLRLDALSALFLALLSVVGGAGAVYAREYWPDQAHPRSARSGRVWWAALLLSVAGVLVASNGLHFLVAWEIFAVSSYFLITLDRPRREVRDAGWLYLAASHAATLSLFAFFALLAARTGSWELGPMRGQTELAPLFWLALFAFGVKAGLFPLHIWLPSAHANAPSHVSAIMSGVTIKLGIYGLVRFSGWLPVPAGAGGALVGLGVISAVLGVAFALGQHDLKRLLAYHSVENIGIIVIGLGFAVMAVQHGNAAWGVLALAGGLLHVWNHGLFKSLLFFGAGSVLHATGTREMSRLGGLWRSMPWTAGLFALGAAAISGLPPLNGFISEWLIYLGLFAAVDLSGATALTAVPAVVLLAMTGALALACFIKVCGVVFLGAPRTAAAENLHESGPWMRGPMLILAGGCAAIGLAPAFFWPAIMRAAADWNPAWSVAETPASLKTLGACNVGLALGAVLAALLLGQWTRKRGLRRALTWDCGYAVPTPRMQYTAGSLAATITEWFAWILRPERHEQRPVELFPARASFEEHTPETVLERVIEPAGGMVMQLSVAARRLQHGRLQAYLLYLVVGLTVLTFIVFMEGGR